MKVIAFSLSLFHPFVKLSKEGLTKDASHRLTFRVSKRGKEHVTQDFSQGSWRGYMVLMAFSLRNRTPIVSWRFGRSASLPRSSKSTVVTEDRELRRTVTWTLNDNFVTMPLVTTLGALFVVCLVSFGAMYFEGSLFGTLLKTMLQGMGLGQL